MGHTIGEHKCKQKSVNNKNKEMLTIRSKLKMLTAKSPSMLSTLTYEVTHLQSKIEKIGWQNNALMTYVFTNTELRYIMKQISFSVSSNMNSSAIRKSIFDSTSKDIC